MKFLDEIVLLIGCIADIYIVFDFYKNFFQIRKIVMSKERVIWCSILSIGMIFMINQFENAYVNLFFFPLILWVYVTTLFDTDTACRLFYLVISLSMILGCEFLYVVLLKLPTYVVKQSSYLELSDITWQLIAMKLLTYMLFSVLKQLSNKSKRRLPGKIFLKYLCVPIASLSIMLLTYYAGVDFSENVIIKVMLTVCFSLLLLGNILMFCAFNSHANEVIIGLQQKLIIEQKDVELKYYIQVSKINEEHKEFIHNTSNYLKMIGELAKANKNESILNIVKDLNIELECNEMKLYCEKPVLNAILTEKGIRAEKQEISFDAYVEPGVCFGKVTDTDLIAMLSNLLDNAIRAAASCEENRSVKVRIFMQNKGNFCVIKIINMFTGKIYKIEDRFLSTKEESGIHGVGIKSVESTAKKYDGYLNCFIKEKEFKSVLLLSIS